MDCVDDVVQRHRKVQAVDVAELYVGHVLQDGVGQQLGGPEHLGDPGAGPRRHDEALLGAPPAVVVLVGRAHELPGDRGHVLGHLDEARLLPGRQLDRPAPPAGMPRRGGGRRPLAAPGLFDLHRRLALPGRLDGLPGVLAELVAVDVLAVEVYAQLLVAAVKLWLDVPAQVDVLEELDQRVDVADGAAKRRDLGVLKKGAAKDG